MSLETRVEMLGETTPVPLQHDSGSGESDGGYQTHRA